MLRFFGSTFEDFSDACSTLAAKWKHLLPTGNNRVKVRMTGKDKVKVKESTLGSTLGEESTGMVVMDYEVFLCVSLYLINYVACDPLPSQRHSSTASPRWRAAQL